MSPHHSPSRLGGFAVRQLWDDLKRQRGGHRPSRRFRQGRIFVRRRLPSRRWLQRIYRKHGAGKLTLPRLPPAQAIEWSEALHLTALQATARPEFGKTGALALIVATLESLGSDSTNGFRHKGPEKLQRISKPIGALSFLPDRVTSGANSNLWIVRL